MAAAIPTAAAEMSTMTRRAMTGNPTADVESPRRSDEMRAPFLDAYECR
jgi:hypothetical protein